MAEMSTRDKLAQMIESDGVTVKSRRNPNRVDQMQYIGYVDGNEVDRANTITALVNTLWRMFAR